MQERSPKKFDSGDTVTFQRATVTPLREKTPPRGKETQGAVMVMFDPRAAEREERRAREKELGQRISVGRDAYLAEQRERVVVIDPAGTFYVSPILKFQEAKDLHAQQSTFATLALLERSPKGFDNEDLLKQMFLKAAVEKATAQRFLEETEFKAKQLHQKAEVARIDILQTRENFVLTQVTGQLIRNGIFQDKAFSESIPFKLSLKFMRNPNMVLNGRFPTAVGDFKYETTR